MKNIEGLVYQARKPLLSFPWKIAPLSPAWRDSLIAFSVGRILFSIWGALIWKMRLMPDHWGPYYGKIQPILEGAPGALVGMWQRWDGIHYQQIATYGYTDDYLTAFFPLFPMLGRLVSRVTGLSELLSLIVVSNLAFLFCLVLLHKIVSQHFSPGLSRATLLALLTFPSTFFFYAVYPQSLLLLWILLAYWLATHQKWFGAALVGLLAGFTHLTSVPLSILLGIEALQTLRRDKRGPFSVIILLAPLTNLLAIACFLAWRSTISHASYLETQTTYGRTFHWPWETLVIVYKFVSSLPLDYTVTVSWINVGVFLLLIILSILNIRRLPLSLWAFQATMIVFLLLNTFENDPLGSIIRYTLVIFPFFIEVAAFGQQPTWKLAKFAIGSLLLLICSALFFMWKAGVS